MKNIVYLVCFFLLSCSGKIPGDVIKPDKMQAVLWDYIQVENFVKTYIAQDTAKRSLDSSAVLLQRVYKKHYVTREEFNKSLKFYASNEDLMQRLLDTMSIRNQQTLQMPEKLE